MARRIGRAWGNALGGWRLQGRGPRGRFLHKGAPSIKAKSNYRPSRNQIAAEQRQKAAARAQRREKAKKVAKNAAIVGGVALAAGGAYYGARSASITQRGIYDTRQGAKFVRNAAKYTRGPSASKVPGAAVMKAGSFPQVRMSPRAPIGLQGFSNAATVSHNVSKLLPPVSFQTNTRRPARYRTTGDALKNVQLNDMTGKELIPERDMTREIRSINMRKNNWKRKANNAVAAAKAAREAKPVTPPPTKKEKQASVQNPSKAPAKSKAPKTSKPAASTKSKAKSPSTKAKETSPKSSLKSKNVAAPSGQMTIDDIAPEKPAVGNGSKKTKSSPAKQAATGGNAKRNKAADAALPKDYYENNPAPLADSDDVHISGGKLRSVDQYGEEVVIPIAGRRNPRSSKPVGSKPGAPRPPRAMNQPKPQETVQKQASTASKSSLDTTNGSTTITAAALLKPGKVDHNSAWYAKRFNLAEIERVAKDATMNAPKIKAALVGIGASKADAALFAKGVQDFRKAGKRARGRTLDGRKVTKAEARAQSLAGDVVTKTKSEAQRIADINDKMASGKMAGPSQGEVKQAMDLLKGLGGMHTYPASMLWEEATGPNKTLYSIEERKAMRLISNWKNLKRKG